MRHQKVICGLLVMLMLLATACTGNSTNGITAKKAKGLPSSIPAHLSQKLSKHVNLNADVVIPAGIKEVPILKAGIYKIAPQKLRETFKIKTYDATEYSTHVIKRVKVSQNQDGSSQELAFGKLCGKDGKPLLISDIIFNHGIESEIENDRLLVYGGSQTIFMATEYNYAFYGFQRDTTSGEYFVDWYKKKQLPFMTPANAFNEVSKTMSSFGLNVAGSHDTYCLDWQTSSQLVGCNAGSLYINYVSNFFQYLQGKSDWDTYDDYYYFVLYPKYHGIPIAEGDGSTIEGGTLDVAYCERGIEYLMANSLYKETGVLQSDVPVYGLDGALQMLKYKYDNTILTEPVTVSSIRFCYVPVPMSKNSTDYKLVPGWQFTIKKVAMNVNGETEASNFGDASAQIDTINIYFDATTGKEIIGSTPRL